MFTWISTCGESTGKSQQTGSKSNSNKMASLLPPSLSRFQLQKRRMCGIKCTVPLPACELTTKGHRLSAEDEIQKLYSFELLLPIFF